MKLSDEEVQMVYEAIRPIIFKIVERSFLNYMKHNSAPNRDIELEWSKFKKFLAANFRNNRGNYKSNPTRPHREN